VFATISSLIAMLSLDGGVTTSPQSPRPSLFTMLALAVVLGIVLTFVLLVFPGHGFVDDVDVVIED